MQWKRGAPNRLRKSIVYPLYDPIPYLSIFEKWMVRMGIGLLGRCTVCGCAGVMIVKHEDLRETCACLRCKSTNRQRQIAYVICCVLDGTRSRRLSSLRSLRSIEDLVIYNTEARGALHLALSGMKNYICSEYFGAGYQGGETVAGTTHQNLMNLSLRSESVDLVISSDVFEHIADPYKAHGELYRILRTGGRHIFTVPYYPCDYLDETRAVVSEEGKNVLLQKPIYHYDPIRVKDGALVYTIFSLEMLCRLRKIGFRTNMYHLYKPWYGIFGSHGLVFEAVKEW